MTQKVFSKIQKIVLIFKILHHLLMVDKIFNFFVSFRRIQCRYVTNLFFFFMFFVCAAFKVKAPKKKCFHNILQKHFVIWADNYTNSVSLSAQTNHKNRQFKKTRFLFDPKKYLVEDFSHKTRLTNICLFLSCNVNAIFKIFKHFSVAPE